MIYFDVLGEEKTDVRVPQQLFKDFSIYLKN
jgi:hypothetical protein